MTFEKTELFKVMEFFENDFSKYMVFDRKNLNLLEEIIDVFLDESNYSKYIDYFCFRKKVPLNVVIDKLERIILIWALTKFNGNQKYNPIFVGKCPDPNRKDACDKFCPKKYNDDYVVTQLCQSNINETPCKLSKYKKSCCCQAK